MASGQVALVSLHSFRPILFRAWRIPLALAISLGYMLLCSGYIGRGILSNDSNNLGDGPIRADVELAYTLYRMLIL